MDKTLIALRKKSLENEIVHFEKQIELVDNSFMKNILLNECLAPMKKKINALICLYEVE